MCSSTGACLAVVIGIVAAGIPAFSQIATAPFCQVHLVNRQVALTGPDATPVHPFGTRKLLYLRMRFPDDTADPVSQVEAEASLAEVNTVFRRISYGAFGIEATVSSVLAFTKSRNAYEGPGGFDKFLDDARAIGIAAGFDYRQYDLEVVRHSGVPGFAGGNARLGFRGAQVQVGGTVILLHELGHNLGLSHANFWDTSGPGLSLGSPPLPSNFETLPEPRSIPIHPDSQTGHDTVTGPGQALEYGDLWDIMGTGDADFNATYKSYLGWMPSGSIIEAPVGLSVHRLYGLEETTPDNGKVRSIRIRGPANGPAGARDYSVELPVTREGVSPAPGVLLRWVDLSANRGSSLILDGTLWSLGGNADAILPPGRTFSDRVTGVHVTMDGAGVDGQQKWVDVVIQRGLFSSNAAPTVSLLASALFVNAGEPVTFIAVGTDTDGDSLSWFWEFGDGTSTTNTAELLHTWSRGGEFVVRTEVSDRRGGVASAHVVVRVSEPTTRRISGHVWDPQGNPVLGVRVHNGLGGAGRPSETLIQARSDSSGAYTLAALPPGRYHVSAFHPDYVAIRRAPVELLEADIEGIDIVVEPLPRITVSGPKVLLESAGFTNLFQFTRSGPTNQPLTVLYRLGGTATGGGDYARPLVDRLVIPAGSREASLGLVVIDDQQGEDTETITLSVADSVRSDRVDDRGNPFSVFYPGWEIVTHEGVIHWTHTRPEYVAAAGAEIEVGLLDDDESAPQTVSVTANDLIALEEPVVEGIFFLERTGDTRDSLTVRLAIAGTASPGTDYEVIPDSIQFLPDETFRSLFVRPLADAVEEPDEEVELRILPGTGYGVGLGTATISVRDRLEFPQTLGVKLLRDLQVELTMRGAPGSRLVLESGPDFRNWTPIRTNQLFNTDAVTIVLPPAGGERFFRTAKQ